MPPRLITLTLNPALDIACYADVVQHTHKIRTGDDHLDPGGGGMNVARVMHELGGDTLAVMMAGGVTGALIEEMLDEVGVPRRTIPIRDRSRICFTVLERSTGLEYRFVPEGPDVNEHDWQRMLERAGGDAGGLADRQRQPGARHAGGHLCARGARRRLERGQRFVLDTSGPALRAALGQRHRADQAEPGRAGNAGRARAARPARTGGGGAGLGAGGGGAAGGGDAGRSTARSSPRPRA